MFPFLFPPFQPKARESGDNCSPEESREGESAHIIGVSVTSLVLHRDELDNRGMLRPDQIEPLHIVIRFQRSKCRILLMTLVNFVPWDRPGEGSCW